MTLLILALLFSIFVLTYGADLSLETSEKIGNAIGLSPLVIGIVLVGLGTSLPELFVSHLACLNSKGEVALGNVLGSNIANILLILGICLFLVDLSVKGKALKKQFQYHFVISLLLLFILRSEKFLTISSLILILIFGLFIFQIFKDMKKSLHSHPDIERRVKIDEKEQKKKVEVSQVEMAVNIIKLIIGFSLLYFGGELLVYAGSGLGKHFGVSDYVISAILLAFGTSFPELVTCLLACKKKKDTEVILGNILGSNIFNITFVLGSVGFYNFPLNGNYYLESSVLILISLFFLFMNKLKRPLTKRHGIGFIATYLFVLYIWI